MADTRTIEWDPSALLNGLDVMARVQLPFMASLTLNRSINPIKQAIRQNMQDTFTYLVPYTQTSLGHNGVSTKQRLFIEIGFDIRGARAKGNSASDYLQPQVRGGKVFETRFQKRLKRRGLMPEYAFMQPLHDSPAAQLDATGRIKAAQYVQALFGIKAMEDVRLAGGRGPARYRTLGSYVYSGYGGDAGYKAVYRKGKPLPPGIYKVQGTQLIQVFKQLRRTPSVAPKFRWPDVGVEAANDILPKTFAEVYRQVIRR